MHVQAPQRERVSMAALPLSKQESRAANRRRYKKRWPEMLHPDKRMGVPHLMMLLEPNVVWDHTRAFVQELGMDVESQYGKGELSQLGQDSKGLELGAPWVAVSAMSAQSTHGLGEGVCCNTACAGSLCACGAAAQVGC